jgi:hypothetical protein
MFGSNVKHSLEAEKKGSGSASLEDDLVRKDKHARLGEKVRIHHLTLKNRQDLAIDHVKHGNPGIGRNSLETIDRSSRRQSRRTRSEPNLEKLLRTLKSVGRVEVGGYVMVDCEMRSSRGGRKGAVVRDGGHGGGGWFSVLCPVAESAEH